jgi:hypothetical protein
MIGPSSSMVYQSQDQVHVSEAAMIALHDLSAHASLGRNPMLATTRRCPIAGSTGHR